MVKMQAEHEIEQRHDREPHERHGRQGAASARVASRRGSAIRMLSPRTLLTFMAASEHPEAKAPGGWQHLASSQEDYATRTATDDIQYGCLLFQKHRLVIRDCPGTNPRTVRELSRSQTWITHPPWGRDSPGRFRAWSNSARCGSAPCLTAWPWRPRATASSSPTSNRAACS